MELTKSGTSSAECPTFRAILNGCPERSRRVGMPLLFHHTWPGEHGEIDE